jgi:hypothetical protein
VTPGPVVLRLDLRRVGVDHVLELAAVGLLLSNKGVAPMLVRHEVAAEIAFPAFDES